MRKQLLLAALAAAAPMGAASSAFGQARTWDGGTDADNKWSTANNWNTDTVPPVSAPTEGWRFGSSATELITNMDNSYSFGQLQFNGSPGYVINSDNGSSMSLAGFNTGQVITITTGNTATLNVPVTLNALNVTNNSGESLRRTIDTTGTAGLTLNGALTAQPTQTVRKIGTGTLTLGAANTIATAVELNAGTLRVGNDLALGAAPFSNPTGNSVRLLPDGGDRTLANALNISGLGGVGFTEDNGFNMTLSGPINLGTTGATALGAGLNTTVTINGVVTGAAGFGKGAQGTMILNNNNTYTGTTTVANGRLIVNGTNTSDTLVGAGILAGTGSVQVLSVFGTGTLSPGSDTMADTIDAGRADFVDGGSYLFNLNNVAGGAGIGWDLLNLNGLGTANANLDVTAGPGGFTISLTGPGSGFDEGLSQMFKIVDAAAVTNFDPADFLIDASGFAPSYSGAFSVSDANGDLNLVYTAVPEPASMGVLALLGAALMVRGRRC